MIMDSFGSFPTLECDTGCLTCTFHFTADRDDTGVDFRPLLEPGVARRSRLYVVTMVGLYP